MAEKNSENKWYVVRAVSGQENKIKTYIENEISRLGMDTFVEEILVPQEKVVQIRNGKKVTKDKTYFPGYIMIKGLCGQPDVMHYLVDKLADKVAKACPQVDFINGNVTGGVVTGWLLRDKLSEKLGRNIPFVYLRGARKRGGHDELITGIHNNSTIKKGMNVVVVEELVNSGMTTINAVSHYPR